MNEITVENYRCFRAVQSARLAPLTILVGENSTGKTSFMAIVRALWDLAYGLGSPDFKEQPYDLGSFDEIVHRNSARDGQADGFQAGFVAQGGNGDEPAIGFSFAFEREGTAPVPVRRRIAQGTTWIDETHRPTEPYMLRVGTSAGSWDMQIPDGLVEAVTFVEGAFGRLAPLYYGLEVGVRAEGK